MRILVTGGCGFIGSNLVRHILETRPEIEITNVDLLTYAGDRSHLAEFENLPRYSFEQVDIRDAAALKRIFDRDHPEGVIHLAAESHVDNSISGPSDFITTNLLGTFNLLEAARAEQNTTGRNVRFLHVSTDEVYGELGAEGAFTEDDPYRPNSPYSASKAGSDHLVRSWGVTYGMDVVTTNCSNNFGPRQHREKLIPTVIATALAHRPIPVYGRGENVRDWLYVEDHCRAIERVFDEGKRGETYLIGTRNEWKNIDLVREICTVLDEERSDAPEGGYASLISFVTDRPGHDHRYAVDPSKIASELGWRAEGDFRTALRATVRWYIERFELSAEEKGT